MIYLSYILNNYSNCMKFLKTIICIFLIYYIIAATCGPRYSEQSSNKA